MSKEDKYTEGFNEGVSFAIKHRRWDERLKGYNIKIRLPKEFDPRGSDYEAGFSEGLKTGLNQK